MSMVVDMCVIWSENFLHHQRQEPRYPRGMLSVRELLVRDDNRAREHHESYKILYEKTANHIRRRNILGFKSTVWTVDSFIPGRRPFEYTHAVRYVCEKLRKGGFEAFVDEQTLAIVVDWSPTAQARTKKKTKKTNDSRAKKVDEQILKRWNDDDEKRMSEKAKKEDLQQRLKRLNAQAISLK